MEKEDLTNCDKLICELKKCNEIQQIHSLSLEISAKKCKDGLAEIMNKISDKLTLNYRGTLLYACSEYDCSEYFSVIISNLILGSYEASIEAYNLIIENIDYNRLKLQEIEEAINKLAVYDKNSENTEIIKETIKFLKKM